MPTEILRAQRTYIVVSLLHHYPIDKQSHIRRGVVGIDCNRFAVISGAAPCCIILHLYFSLLAGFYGLFGICRRGATTARCYVKDVEVGLAGVCECECVFAFGVTRNGNCVEPVLAYLELYCGTFFCHDNRRSIDNNLSALRKGRAKERRCYNQQYKYSHARLFN